MYGASNINSAEIPQVCEGPVSPSKMECMSPACEDSEGVLSVDMDGATNLISLPFYCYPSGRPIPFEHDDNMLLLEPGKDRVSLHVCLHLLLISRYECLLLIILISHIVKVNMLCALFLKSASD